MNHSTGGGFDAADRGNAAPSTIAEPRWVFHPRRDPERARALALALDAPLAAAEALVIRGIGSPDEAMAFLSPSLASLHDPYALRGLDRAVERLRRAGEHGESVMIHGDYDVDGITSTYVLVRTLDALGLTVSYRIPHRMRDGYGLTEDAVEDAHRRGCDVIVTVDCGITAIQPVARARALGIDVVITDHHAVSGRLPDAVAIVNPRQPGCAYPFKQLAGVGVTYKLAAALLDGTSALDAEAFLDVVAIGTIADVVPLVGENRVLAKHGLQRLNEGPRLGLQALLEVAGLGGKAVSSGQVAFVLAPRINAAGRMGNAEQGLRLLLARDPGEARSLAESLEEDNDRRRVHDGEVLEDACRQLDAELDWPRCASILLWSDRWHPGVIGIVASRMVERFQRPTLLVALDGPTGRGSGRSLQGLDLSEVLDACADLLEGHGGHALAAGLTVKRERLPEFRERFETLVHARLAPEDIQPTLAIDGELSLDACGPHLVDWLTRLAPHGLGNPEAVYRADGVRVSGLGVVGGGRHLRLTARQGATAIEAIGFGMADRAPSLSTGGRCDLAFTPIRNEWMGTSRIQLKLRGVRPW